MRTTALHQAAPTAFGLAGLLLAGCLGTTPPSTFYLLKALPEPEGGAAARDGVSVEVGPVALPAYLDRPQLAAAGGDHVLAIDQTHRWAEPLGDGFTRVLSENLAILLGTPNVYRHSQRRGAPVDFQVEVVVTRFDPDANGRAVLAAVWSVIGDGGKTVLSRKRSSLSVPAAAASPGAMVAAQNEALHAFSREVAAEIRRLGR